jgi:lipopolysaccharide transport system permease protein
LQEVSHNVSRLIQVEPVAPAPAGVRSGNSRVGGLSLYREATGGVTAILSKLLKGSPRHCRAERPAEIGGYSDMNLGAARVPPIWPSMGKATFFLSVVSATVAGLEELMGGLYNWRVWHLLGVSELRNRYARSRFGQGWVVLSTGAMIGTLAGIWSLLWNQSLPELMPFIGISIIMWNFLAQILSECPSIFVMHSNYYHNQRMNFSVSIYSVIYKNTIILAHNFIIVIALIIVFGLPINRWLLQIIPAFALTLITMTWLGYLVAMMCVRYRDVIQLITTWLTVLFFITPVMWKPDFLPPGYQFIVDWNPLAQFLELLRAPLLGRPVSAHTWGITIALALVGGVLSLPVIGRYQRRVIFWM